MDVPHRMAQSPRQRPRYRMAVADMVPGSQAPGPEELTARSAILSTSLLHRFHPLLLIMRRICPRSQKSRSASEKPIARIDDSPSPSIGLVVRCRAREGERWDREKLVYSTFSGHAR
jgi:hypothetical protein